MRQTFASKQKAYGFSLIEVAVVMLIMGSLLSGLLVALTQSTENSRRKASESQLTRIAEALYAFAQANGRLPCPATSDSAGLENPVGGGDCIARHGFVPVATLGLYGQINDDGLMRDPWANPYRYSVSDKLVGGSRAFTSATGLRNLFENIATELVAGADIIQVCDEDTCAVNTPLIDTAPAVLFSMGENWVSTNSVCNLVPDGNVDPDEHANSGAMLDGVYCVANQNNMNFVSRTYVEDVFDDIVIWLSPHVLFGRLIAAGQLP